MYAPSANRSAAATFEAIPGWHSARPLLQDRALVPGPGAGYPSPISIGVKVVAEISPAARKAAILGPLSASSWLAWSWFRRCQAPVERGHAVLKRPVPLS